MRVVARVVTAALAAGLLLAPGASAAKPKRSLTVGLVSKSQDKLLRANRVTASVYSKRRGRVRVTAVARSTASRGHGRRVAVTRVVAFRKAGRKHVTLKLTATGRRVLSACGGRRMVLGARLKGARRSVTASDVLRIDRGACQTQTTADITTRNADRCDYLDPSYCLYPWPNDFFTKPDESTPTGERLNLNRQSTPANTAGVHIDPSDQNRADGFSPGNLLVTHVPGMDNQEAWQRTGAVPITDIARYADTDQPVVVINADTGRRQPIWTELDVNATEPSKANLIIRPARNWDEGARYLVALRNLKTKDGKTIDPQPEFRAFRDRLTTKDAAFEARRAHMEDVIGRLAQAGIARDDLYLAWDFTVASEKSLAGRMLKIRDDAFAQLGDTDLADGKVDGSAPNFVVTKVDDLAPCGSDGCQSGEDDKIGRRVTGNILVPCYLDAPGCPPGSRFNYAGSTPGVPAQLPGNTALAPFVCDIPRQQTDSGAPPARPSLYGHGLLGSADEVNAGNVESMAQEHNFVFCATDWAGMSQSDIPNVAHLLIDLSDFPTLADRTQQGMLNFLYLGRAMVHPQGFDANPAFQVGTVPHGAIDTTKLFYDGNSQGGIMGGGLTAVAPDFEHAALGVPGMNYSLLLRRSVDFDQYAQIMYQSYPDTGERPLVLSLIQQLWDRGEADGYAHHMTTDPLPNTPAHAVLMQPAFGDHQVTNAAADVEARTIGARTHDPALDPGRSYEKQPLFGIGRFSAFPYAGSAIIYYDTGPVRPDATDGTATPPTTETPPRPPDYGADPHSKPRSTVTARQQKSDWLQVGGVITDPCGGAPCHAGTLLGP